MFIAILCGVNVLLIRGSGRDEALPMLRTAIGLGIPFFAIVIMLPFVNKVSVSVYGVPFLYLWMFAWFVLTSVCLGGCWLLFDRHRPVTDGGDQV